MRGICLFYRYKKRMQAMLDEEDDLYTQIVSNNESLDNSTLNMQSLS